MHAIFNSPVSPYGRRNGMHGVGSAHDVVPLFQPAAAVTHPLGSHHANSTQPHPASRWVEIGQHLRIADHPLVAYFNAPVIALHAAILHMRHITPAIGVGITEGIRNVVEAVLLILLDA